jgi:hypothetical protein
MSKEEDEIIKKLLTPSQMKILKDQEQWMKDVNENYTDERTRIDAAYDIKARFPTERSAQLALDMYAGDPVVLQLYRLGLAQKRRKTKKNIKSTRKCKCK